MRQSRLKKFWSEFRDQPWIFQFGEGLALVLIAAGLLLPGPVRAASEMVFKDGELEVRLHDVPCRHAVLAEGLKEAGSEGHVGAATVVIRGNSIPACWGRTGEKVLIGDVLGNGGYIMASDFKANPGI